MKALWLVRPDLDASPGGDTTQIHETARALGARGVSVELSSVPRPSLDGHDIVHLFHLDRLWENLPHARRIAREQRPAVLSTIWWPTTEFDLAGRRGLQGLAARRLGSSYAGFKVWQRSLLRFVRQGLRPSQRPIARFDRAAQELLDAVRVLLPNSASEAREIMTRFGERTPVVVVPNAADIEFWTPAVEPLERSGIVCVGRIEPRKNQLALIEAVRELDVDLTLIGRAGGYARRYEAQCRSAASARVRFAGQLDPCAAEVVPHPLRTGPRVPQLVRDAGPREPRGGAVRGADRRDAWRLYGRVLQRLGHVLGGYRRGEAPGGPARGHAGAANPGGGARPPAALQLERGCRSHAASLRTGAVRLS